MTLEEKNIMLRNFEKRVNPKIEKEKQEKEKVLSKQIQNAIKHHYNQFFCLIGMSFCLLVLVILSCSIEFQAYIILMSIAFIICTIACLVSFKTINNLNDSLENKVILKEYLWEWLQSN